MRIFYLSKIIFFFFSNFVFLVEAKAQEDAIENSLTALIDATSEIRVTTKNKKEYSAAVRQYKDILSSARSIQYETLSLNDQVDYDLLISHVKTKIFEYETIKLYTLHPVSYFVLGRTNSLFTRPGAIADRGIREAIKELYRLPEILSNAKENLSNPARVWTQNAIYQAYYAGMLLNDSIPMARVDDPKLKRELIQAAKKASRSVKSFENRLEKDVEQVSSSSKVDLNNLIKRIREEEKKSKRTSVYVSAAAVSALAVFGIILTL